MKPRTFFTGCTHFSHEKIIKLARRPFGSVEEMNETLRENWNATVGENDLVIHLGDISWGNVSEDLSRLNGRKYVLAGNHDDRAQLIEAKRDGVILDFKDYHRMDVVLDPAARPLDPVALVLFHYPIDDWDGRFRGSLHLHCHTHAAELRNPSIPVVGAGDNFSKGEEPGSLPVNYPPEVMCNRFNVGVDACGFAPVPLERIIEESRQA